MAEATPHWSNLTQAYFPQVERGAWYSSVAETYARVRPRYPSAAIDIALAWANLPPRAHILEIGAGPGLATLDFAQRGFSLTSIEPSLAACELARQACIAYASVSVIHSTFEAWPGGAKKFDGVLAATSFHWLNPETRCQKIAALLRPGAPLILLWNVPPQPDPEILQATAATYQRFAPHLGHYEPPDQHLAALQILEKHILESGYFETFRSTHQAWALTYSVADYLALLSTLSPYMALEQTHQQALFCELELVLTQAWGDVLTLNCFTGIQVACAHQ